MEEAPRAQEQLRRLLPSGAAAAAGSVRRLSGPLSDEAKLKLKIKELQRQSLIKEQKEEAPRLPETSWRLFYSLKVPNIERKTPFVLGEFMALIAREFKSLPAAELEELSVKAAQNKVTNELALKDWVLKHPPVQIHEANLARTHLKRLGRPNTRTHKLHDDRIPVKFKGSFMYYVKSRANSADVAHMSTVEKAGLLGREWRSLEAAERKPFEEMAAIDRERYLKEKDAFIKGKKTST
ncbi:hypothetical protein N0V88_004406 [Collariella sp. IMI 366227]|nr:hypothetical protein N0V88_004406 [Collariella sp. IMI 366227]